MPLGAGGVNSKSFWLWCRNCCCHWQNFTVLLYAWGVLCFVEMLQFVEPYVLLFPQLSLFMLDAVVRYSCLPSNSLYEFITTVCRTVNTEKFCHHSWKVLSHVHHVTMLHVESMPVVLYLECTLTCATPGNPSPRGGGYPVYKPYRYVPPQRVSFSGISSPK